jgi:hypothetical protein
MPNPRILPDASYVDGSALPASWWASLDTAQEQAVDGDAGGTWANPAMNVSGAGFWCCGPWTFTGSFGFSPGVPCTFGDGDDFELDFSHFLASRQLVAELATGWDASFGPARMSFDDATDRENDSGAATYTTGARMMVPLRVHHGGTLGSVQIYFKVGQNHTDVPPSLPQFRVIQVDTQGNVTPLCTNTALFGWVGNGFIQFNIPVGSGAAWYAGGATQSVTYPVDGAGVIVDLTQYSYYLEIIDEQGTTNGTDVYFGNKYYTAIANIFHIPSLAFQ